MACVLRLMRQGREAMKCKARHVLAGLILLVALFVVARPLRAQEGPPRRQEPGPNLLVNPGFEGIGRPVHNAEPNPDNWTRDTFNGAQYGEIFTPAGWAAWWEEEFGRPEYKVIPNEPPFNTPPLRVHAGYYSALCFGFYRPLHAGFYQVVRGIPPHSLVEGAFMAHAWTCGEDNPPLSCGDPNAFYFRVGIDPDGNTDPLSENIVWSDPYYNYDTFTRVGPIQATVGVTGVATLFLEALGKWPNKHNDAYWDNASLRVVVTGTFPTPTPLPPPPTPAAPLAPPATATLLPEGTILHTAAAGDTWLGIALVYGVDLVELRRLNAGMSEANGALALGQPVIVKAAAGESAGPAATPTLHVLPATGVVQPQRPVGDRGALCVLAFDDVNGDEVRQAEGSERTLPDAEITLVAAGGGHSISYRTDGNEPYCFQDLPADQLYLVRHTPPPGYVTTAGPWNLRVSGGQVYQVALAYTRTPASPPRSPAILSLGLRLGGGIILLLAAVSGIYFVRARRP